MRSAVESDGFADDIGIAVKGGAPEMVAEERHNWAARLVFLGSVEPPDLRLNAENVEVAGRYSVTDQQLRRALSGESLFIVIRRRQILEDAAALLPDGEIRGSAGHGLAALGGVGCPHGDDSDGVVVWQRGEQDGFDHGEDCGVCADAEREGERGGQRKSGRLAKLTQGEPQIVGEDFKKWQ